ncbi:MAG: pyridoxamine 5'-phosphate oxidase family protein [Pseudomonadota bacterium]
MGKEYDGIDERMQGWIEKQRMFFVATAPLDANGHVNCSPKGLDSLRVLGPLKLAYVDVGGSGIETVAHIRENKRITIMLCAFDGPPKIFRFYGLGRTVEPGDAEFDALVAQFPEQPTVRNVVVVDVERIMDSCGYGVPEMDFRKDRESMANWVRSKTDDELVQYRRDNNSQSLDGLPGLRFE